MFCIFCLVMMKVDAEERNNEKYNKIDSLIQQMSIDEKARLCFGGEKFGVVVFPGNDRLGIPPMYPADGPRGPVGWPVTAFPAGLGLASCWDEDLFQRIGEVIGCEARAEGLTLVFGPAMNLNRDPLGGRFFEYLSEDPVLSGRLAGAQAKGIQNLQVAACLKHFAANGRELNRNWYMSNVDERTLRELYLRNFEIAFRKSGAWSFMTAANGLNGELCSDSKFLLNDILKGEWGFKGMVMTDFCHSRSTEKAALAGLDMDMPWGDYKTIAFGKPLADAVRAGRVSEKVLDDMVRRILWVRQNTGLLDGRDAKEGGIVNTSEHQKIALEAAESSIVLLKNKNHLLPLDVNKIKKMVVMGPNCDRRFCIHGLGGSSGAQGYYEVTPLAALKKQADKKGFKLDYIPLAGASEYKVLTLENMKTLDGRPGITTRFYNSLSGELVADTIASQINYRWLNESPYPDKIPVGCTRIDCEGYIVAPETGTYTLRVSSDCPVEFWVDDRGAQALRNVESGTPQVNTAMVFMEKGKEYYVRLWYTQNPQGVKNSLEMNHWNKAALSISMEWALPATPQSVTEQIAPYKEQIRNADIVVFVGGTDHNLDCEGRDRKNMIFPEGQAELVKQISQIQPDIVSVLYHGSPLSTEWMAYTPAVIDAFFPGMEGGTAIANVLFGDTNPSGRLSFSWLAKVEDSPVYKVATQNYDEVNYTEGLLMGYRWFDAKNIAPVFPFGYGLSYTTFEYSDMKIKKQKDGKVRVSVKVKNTGHHSGKETVQLYVGQEHPLFFRPLKELKDFSKISLDPGKSKVVDFMLDDEAFSYWHPDKHQWCVDKDTFVIEIGKSSRDICCRKRLEILK